MVDEFYWFKNHASGDFSAAPGNNKKIDNYSRMDRNFLSRLYLFGTLYSHTDPSGRQHLTVSGPISHWVADGTNRVAKIFQTGVLQQTEKKWRKSLKSRSEVLRTVKITTFYISLLV